MASQPLLVSAPLGLTKAQEEISTILQTDESDDSPSSSSSPLLSTTTRGTVLYLAYGSNLCAATFRVQRKIKPLSSKPVHVPSLDLTFDLPGVPYMEPCFANTRYRDLSAPPTKAPYHKDRWQKGLIGVVYEVTPEDYRSIIASEGGGASYQDVLVDCYALPAGAESLEVGLEIEGVSFKAHTLLAPKSDGKKRRQRPNPSYAQPSARYLGLITSGAEEHSLPADYMKYLNDIRPFTITTYRQRAGMVVSVSFFLPMVVVLLGLGKLFTDKDGKMPKWLADLMSSAFMATWRLYDVLLKRVFGDGERTIETKGDSAVKLQDGDVEKACTFNRRRMGFWCDKRTATIEEEVRT